MTEIAIKVENLSKNFKVYQEKSTSIFEFLIGRFVRGKSHHTHEVLKNINFTLNKGEMLGIVGFNGMGKTTLLRILSKIYQPTSGSVTLNGKVIPFLELSSGFQPEMTAKENIILYGVLLGIDKAEMLRKIDKILEFAELEKYSNVKIKHFSSGMYGRLAFSTAIQVDPDIIMIDEVLAVGDILFQQKSYDAYMNFKKVGKTIVLVTHSINEIEKLCDKALLIHEGRSQVYGKPNEVIKEYIKLAEKRKNN
ncbi:ABC transporter ATP-binding protein [Nitrosopumilus sp.]|uniref:ABC transporter ATP-binding protein n=1 Tax=Nitrosopumilus sp. TaxID=2024843 RepID=UPI00292F7507|nr:ABC transporter ATP-binding protein [Nitrosopumilus sp.]